MDGLQSVFDEVLDTIQLPFILLGDFSDISTSWGKDKKNGELKFDLVNLINSFNFSQLINEPTRNDSILDLIITNCLGYIYTFGVDDPINDLDHCPIFGHMKVVYKKKSCYLRTISLYNEPNLNELNENLSQVPRNSLLSASNNIDEISDIFTLTLKDKIKM